MLNIDFSEALIYEAMQTVNSTKKFWEQFSGSETPPCVVNRSTNREVAEFILHNDETAPGGDLENFERSSPFSELKRRWHSQTVLQKKNTNSDIVTNNNNTNFRTLDDYVKEDGGEETIIQVGRLKQQWEDLTKTEET